jgi:hypothetical protein
MRRALDPDGPHSIMSEERSEWTRLTLSDLISRSLRKQPVKAPLVSADS